MTSAAGCESGTKCALKLNNSSVLNLKLGFRLRCVASAAKAALTVQCMQIDECPV
jgi:hypothetical protein